MELFDPRNPSDTESIMGTQVSGGGDIPSTTIPREMESFTEVRHEPAAPRSRSIMERMGELAKSMIEPMEAGNAASSPLARFGQTLQAVGGGLQGKHDFWQNQMALEDKMRGSTVDRAMAQRKMGLEEQEFSLKKGEFERKQRAEERKAKAYERLAAKDFSKDKELSWNSLMPIARDLMEAGDVNAGSELLKLGITMQKDANVRAEVGAVTQALKGAKSRQEASTIIQSLPADILKSHGEILMNTMKSQFPEESREKSFNAADLSAFVATNGRQRGPTVPEGMTVPEARATLNEMRTMQQQQINVTTGQQNFQRASSIKDDYTKLVQPYMATRENQRKFEDLAKQGNKITDLALVRQGMMAMDPPNAPSIVRESEAELVERAKAHGIFQPLSFHLERLAGKRSLTDVQREQIAQIVRQNYRARRASYEEQRQIQGKFASDMGQDPEKVLGPALEPIIGGKKQGKGAEGGTTPKYKVTEVPR